MRPGAALAAAVLLSAADPAPTPADPKPAAADYAADARALVPLIAERYAYLDALPGGRVPASSALDAERDAVRDRRTLTRYAEDVLAALADHHAITAGSLGDSWALVPSYADLWIVADGAAGNGAGDGGYRVDAVREGSPAARAGVAAGDRLTAVDGRPVGQAVAAFWSALGLSETPERRAYAARVLAAGQRDRPRRLRFARAGELTLPSLYAVPRPDRPPLDVRAEGERTVIRFNDSLGDDGTVAAFDRALAAIPVRWPLVIDLRDTPGGGNTVVARAVMGAFAARATGYQVHELPEEARATGVPRRWVEQVLPRGARRAAPEVRVGRWTGSMGEGLAAGLAALGAHVCGGGMAGLKGAIYDVALPNTGFGFKLPVERLSTTDGRPRERLVYPPCR